MRHVSVWSFVVVVLAGPLSARAGCEKDTDCKADRICENGRCTSPAAAVRSPRPVEPRREASEGAEEIAATNARNGAAVVAAVSGTAGVVLVVVGSVALTGEDLATRRYAAWAGGGVCLAIGLVATGLALYFENEIAGLRKARGVGLTLAPAPAPTLDPGERADDVSPLAASAFSLFVDF